MRNTRATPCIQETGTASISCQWNTFHAMNLSAAAENIILSSWSTGTRKQYETYTKKWFQYCSQNNSSYAGANVTGIIEFLTDMFTTSTVQYSTFNTTCSMLSSLVEPRDALTIGNHPLIKRFMKGICKLRPLPKYTVTYDAGIVLQYIAHMPPLEQVTLSEVTQTLAALMGLLSGQCAQTLLVLDITYMHVNTDRAIFYILDLLQTSRPSFHQQPLNLLLVGLKRYRPSSTKFNFPNQYDCHNSSRSKNINGHICCRHSTIITDRSFVQLCSRELD